MTFADFLYTIKLSAQLFGMLLFIGLLFGAFGWGWWFATVVVYASCWVIEPLTWNEQR